MASEVANQRRKRGRPSNASREGGSASQEFPIDQQEPDAQERDPEEEARPRKRGRPGKNHGAGPSILQEQHRSENSNAAPRRRRGRPSSGDEQGSQRITTQHAEVVENAEVEPQRRGRGRPAKHAISQVEAEPEEEPDDSSFLRRSGRDRRSVGEWFKATGHPEEEAAEAEDEGNQEDSSFLRRSGRERHSVGEWYRASGAAEPLQADNQSKKLSKDAAKSSKRPARPESDSMPPEKTKKRGRPSLGVTSIREKRKSSDSKPSNPKKRGRPPSMASMDAAAIIRSSQKKARRQGEPSKSREVERDENSGTKGRGRPRISDIIQSQQSQQSQQAKQNPDKQRRSSQEQAALRSESPEPIASPKRKFQHLSSRTRRIPRHVISSKWSPLDENSISTISTLLSTASRPVLLRLTNPNRRADATAAVNAVCNRLRSKLVRGLPFPPATTTMSSSSGSHKRDKGRLDELEFEKTLDGVRILEAQLNPLLHGVDLLKKEKDRMERELEREYKVLNQLSTNARTEARERRERGRKMHELVPERNRDGTFRSPSNETATGELLPAKDGSDHAFHDLQDEELVGLAEQIASHMESMKGNLQQIEGIVPEIVTSEARLRGVLEKNLDQEHFEKVLFG